MDCKGEEKASRDYVSIYMIKALDRHTLLQQQPETFQTLSPAQFTTNIQVVNVTASL